MALNSIHSSVSSLSSTYPHLQKKFFIFEPNLVDIVLITYESYFIVNELLRSDFTIHFNHFQCKCRTSPRAVEFDLSLTAY